MRSCCPCSATHRIGDSAGQPGTRNNRSNQSALISNVKSPKNDPYEDLFLSLVVVAGQVPTSVELQQTIMRV